MSKTLAFEVAFLELLFYGQALANVWDNAASSPITSLYLSGHTSSPGKNGLQTTSEVAYGSYARVGLARSNLAWYVDPATGIVVPLAGVSFPTPTSGSGTITHIGIGRDLGGSGYLFASGAVTPNLVITLGVPPQLTTGSQWSED